MKKYPISLFILTLVYVSYGQLCPTSNFSVNGSVCTNQDIDIDNQSTGATQFYWDFCAGDLATIPTSSTLLNSSFMSRSFDISFQNDAGNWYAFGTSTTGNRVYRMDFQASLDNTPTIGQVTTDGLSSPSGIDLYFDGTSWFGLVANNNDNSLVLLEFESSLSSTPTVKVDANFLPTSEITDIEIFEYNSALYAYVINEADDDIVLLSFGSSLTNTPTILTETITDAVSYTDLSIIKDCDSYYGLLTSYDDRKVIYVTFGTDPTSIASTTELSLTGVSFNSRPTNSVLVNEGGNFYGYVVIQLSGDLVRINFGSSMANTPTGTVLSSLAPAGSRGLGLVRDGTDYYGFITGINDNRLYGLDFSSGCEATTPISTEEKPQVSYSSDGTYTVSLETKDASGNTDYSSNSLTVSTDVAPTINFSIDDSRCVSVTNTFTPSTSGFTYSWDFDGDGMEDSNQESPTYDFSTGAGGPGPGTYAARLTVNDGTCSNFTEQEITIYDTPPTPAFTTSSTNECTNTDITFTNTTDETNHPGVLSYKWDFDNDGVIDSTDPSPTFAYETPGTKTVVLIDSIPGCSVSVQFDDLITINAGPTSAFTATDFSICEEDMVTFTDESTNSPTSWSWIFGNGFTSSLENPPAQLYSDAGNFEVVLATQDAQGCRDTLRQEIAVAPTPAVDFDFDVPCTNPSGIQFSDLTTVTGADIVQRRWFIDNVQVATEQNPSLSFSSSGTVNVRLETVSSNGCENSYNEDIAILEAPVPSFSSIINCQGTASVFEDETPAVGNPVVSWLWTVDGTSYSTRNINHVFNQSGSFEVTLEVTAQNFCSASTTQTVEIQQLPVLSFTIDGECSNELIRLEDTSTQAEDPVVSREWFLDGASVGNGQQNFLSALTDGSYEVSLQLTTQQGCLISGSQSLAINTAPEASFIANRTFGIPGDEILFSDQSTGATGTQWLLNGVAVSTNMAEQSITFTEAGTQQVSLVASNTLGCNDTLTNNILIAVPEVDLAIGQFDLVENGTIGSIFLEIQNNSNLPVEVTNAIIELENQFSVSEQILSLVNVGESQLVNLNVGIPIGVTDLSYLCVTLQSEYTDYPDVNPIDNEKCVTLQPRVVVESPFPNPTNALTRVKVVATEASASTITVLDTSGSMVFQVDNQAISGLNNFFIDLSGLRTGTYFIKVEVGNTSFIERIIKN